MKTFAVILLVLIAAPAAWCQDIQVPVEQQVPLLIKILSFDRNLDRHANKQLVFAILYQNKFRKSLAMKNDFEEALSKYSLTKIDTFPIKLIAIDISEETDLVSTFNLNQVDIVYLAPVKALDIGEITKLSRKMQITSMTGVPEYVNAGISVGVGAKGDKPQILINLKSARAEGVNFNSQLLKLAKIIE